MRLRHALFLAWRHAASGPVRTATLVGGTATALFLPAFSWLVTEVLEDRLLDRASASPVLMGAKGDPFDLTMAALYFRGGVDESVPFGARHVAIPYGHALPLHVHHTASGVPIVGTDTTYLDARGLDLATGRRFAVLGEVVAGAEAAAEFGLEPGDRVRSDLSNLYDLAGAYPYLLDVVGVLQPSDTPDDGALFTDTKTTWMLDGTLHGHTEVTSANAVGSGLETDNNLEATAAIFLTQEVTPATRSTFHLHGDRDDLKVTGFLVLPRDTAAHDQLLGDLALHPTLGAVRPVEVIGTVLDLVLRLRDGLRAAWLLVALSTGAFFVLVLSLTLRLRRRELALLRRLGAGRLTIATLIGTETLFVVMASAATATAATWAAVRFVSLAIG